MDLRIQDERFERANRDAIRTYRLEPLGAMLAKTQAGNPFYRDHWRTAPAGPSSSQGREPP